VILTFSDPTLDLVRHYDFPVPLRCPTHFFLLRLFAAPLSETVQFFSSCSTDFSQQIAQVVLFLFLSAGCTLSVSRQAMCFDVNMRSCLVFARMCL
jgi:hypothetical protein